MGTHQSLPGMMLTFTLCDSPFDHLRTGVSVPSRELTEMQKGAAGGVDSLDYWDFSYMGKYAWN